MTRTILSTKVEGIKLNEETLTAEVTTTYVPKRFKGGKRFTAFDKLVAALAKLGLTFKIKTFEDVKVKWYIPDEIFFKYAVCLGEVTDNGNEDEENDDDEE